MINRKHERNNRKPRKPALKDQFNRNGVKMESDRKPKTFRKEETSD